MMFFPTANELQVNAYTKQYNAWLDDIRVILENRASMGDVKATIPCEDNKYPLVSFEDIIQTLKDKQYKVKTDGEFIEVNWRDAN